MTSACVTFPFTDEPYRTIARFFLSSGTRCISPHDSETRLFLGDIPVVAAADAEHPELLPADRVLFLVTDESLLARGDTTEQAAVMAAVGRFALFVHFFVQMEQLRRTGSLAADARNTVQELLATLHPLPRPAHLTGSIADLESARLAIVEAGRALVTAGLVDSIFGNISCRVDESLLISRTGASLDQLAVGTVVCPLTADDGAPFGASVEYPSHRRIVLETPYRCVLHAHPRWSVIRSLIESSETLAGIPVVAAMPGADLARVLPPAVAAAGAAVVRGHGIFAAGINDFDEPFLLIYRIEREAFDAYRVAFS